MNDGLSARAVPGRPVIVSGIMEVGEEFEHGELMSIYRIKADNVFVPQTTPVNTAIGADNTLLRSKLRGHH